MILHGNELISKYPALASYLILSLGRMLDGLVEDDMALSLPWRVSGV